MRILSERNIHIKKEQAERLKKLSGEEMLTEEMIRSILVKNNSTEKKDTLSYKTIGRFFPSDYTKEQITAVVFELLEEWRESKAGED